MSGNEMTPFLTVSETAALLRVTPRTLHRYRLAGRGPRWRRVGPRLIRYDRQDVVSLAAVQQGAQDDVEAENQGQAEPVDRQDPGNQS